jgi:tRNA pseudouridine55 synthase
VNGIRIAARSRAATDQITKATGVSRPPNNTASGILLVDKQSGITSHDVVARTRRLVGTRKVGHAGTLDPMATGLLVLGINSSTRLLTFVVGLDKEYLATIRLGAATNTDDAEGELGERADAPALAAATDPAIAAAVVEFTGDILQRPSTFSAIKVNGKRAYAMAREGAEVALKPRRVAVSVFEVLQVSRTLGWIDVDVRVQCSSGTYIRALARDLGERLDVGGHLTALRRNRIGPFRVSEAADLDESLVSALIAPAAAARRLFRHIDLNAQQAADLTNGKRIPLAHPEEGMGPIAAIGPSDRLVGLLDIVDGRAHVLANFPADGMSPVDGTSTAGETAADEGAAP